MSEREAFLNLHKAFHSKLTLVIESELLKEENAFLASSFQKKQLPHFANTFDPETCVVVSADKSQCWAFLDCPQMGGDNRPPDIPCHPHKK